MADWYQKHSDVLTLSIYVQPAAKRSEIAGYHGDALRIRLASPPVDGRANDALIEFLAALFEVPLRQVVVKRVEKSRHKTVMIFASAVDPDVVDPRNDNVRTYEKPNAQGTFANTLYASMLLSKAIHGFRRFVKVP